MSVPHATATTHAPQDPPAGRAAAEPSPPGGGTGKAVGLAIVIALAILTVFVCFALPGVKSGAHDVPLGLAAPPPIAAQVERGLGAAHPGAFAITRYDDAAAVQAAVRDRAIYGGLAMGADGRPTMYVASGASPMVAQILTQVADRLGAQMSAATGQPTDLAVVDVAPLTPDDPRGAGLAGAAFPIALGGVLPALVLFREFRRRPWAQVAGASVAAALVGIGVAVVLRSWFGTIPGDAAFWPVAGGLALGVAAITFALLGLGAVAGLPGLALGAAVILLLGNPLSAMASAPELLPSGWGAFGQALPPGANGTLLRSTGFFDGAGGGRPVLVLTAYVVAGLLLIAAGALAGRRRHAPGSVR